MDIDIIKQKKVSIIVPVYNIEKYLNRCILSIVNQIYKNFELILIDDGSSDNSGKICDEWASKDTRISVFHKVNGGVSSARNFGLDHAHGEWIMFVDSDDWLESDYLSHFDIEGDYDMQMQGFTNDYTNRHSNNIGFNKTKDADLPTAIIEATKNYVIYGPVFKLIRKSKIDTDRFDLNYSLGEDYLFILHILQRMNKIKIIVGYGYHYTHERNDSLTHNYKPFMITLDLYNKCDYMRKLLYLKYPIEEVLFTFNKRHLEEFKLILNDFFYNKMNTYSDYRKLISKFDFSHNRTLGLDRRTRYLMKFHILYNNNFISYFVLKLIHELYGVVISKIKSI